jgi:predicted RNA-binding Zn ribbon-like protein
VQNIVKTGTARMRRIRIPAPPDDACLSFANTRYWRGSANPTEDLPDTDALLGWLQKTCGLPAEAVRSARARKDGGMLGGAIALREAIYRLFAAEAAGQRCDPTDLSVLNSALAEAPVREALALGAVKGWDVAWTDASVTALLAPVLWSAGDLLLGPRADRVRQCANPACGWLFLDDSKSGNRRWCSMSACGNRAKAHRHYLRRKGSGS